MKPLRTIFTIVGLMLVHSGIEASADQYRMPEPGANSAARAGYTAPGSFNNFVGDEPVGMPTSYQSEAVMERTSPSSACSGSCKNSAACGSAACGRSLTLWDPWVTFEYMHSWRRARSLPALVTTSSEATQGRLPDATVLFGNDDIGGNLKSAGRLSFGTWLDEDRVLGAGGKFFATEQDSTIFAPPPSEGTPLLARPFFNTDPGAFGQNALVVASTGAPVLAGNVQARASNDLLTAEAYGSYLLYACRGRRLDFIAGYQFARIDDNLVISNTNSRTPPGDQYRFEDAFDVENTYNGGELGLLGEYDAGPITFSALGKLGIGNMHQVLTINGSSSVAFGQPNPPVYEGGLLAMPTNMGTYTSDKFCFVPEADLKMIYRLTKRLDFSLGYSVIYWNKVALAGNQIGTTEGAPTVNASQLLGGALVGPADPAVNGIRDTSFWVQGMTFGLTLKL